MTTLNIELPDKLTEKLHEQGVSIEQIEGVITRFVELYLHQKQLRDLMGMFAPFLSQANDSSQATDDTRPPQNLLHLRGSVPVSEPQDFRAIRQAVIDTKSRQVTNHLKRFDPINVRVP